MTHFSQKQAMSAAVLILVSSFSFVFAEEAELKPVQLGFPVPDFTVSTYQGGTFQLSQMRGKNVLIIFSRGKYDDKNWCGPCHYQYAEYSELDKAQHIREKYNLEIVFVLPYDKQTIEKWIAGMADSLESLEKFKNPPDSDKLDQKVKEQIERGKKLYPLQIKYQKDAVPTPLPILMDTDHKICKGFDTFKTEWSGTKVEQNQPTIYLIDKNGNLQFKYISQFTFDRPRPDYIFKYIEKFML